jgi:hypothetical protein
VKEDAAVTSSTSRLMLGQSNAPGLAFSLRRSIFCLCCLACSASCAIQPRRVSGGGRSRQGQPAAARLPQAGSQQCAAAAPSLCPGRPPRRAERSGACQRSRRRAAASPRRCPPPAFTTPSWPATLTRSRRDGDRESSHKDGRGTKKIRKIIELSSPFDFEPLDDCLRPLTAKRAARRHGHGIGPEKFRRPDSVSTQGTAPG